MNAALTVEQAIEAYALSDYAKLSLQNCIKHDPKTWADKSTVDVAAYALKHTNAIKQLFLATNTDWYPSYSLNGKQYVCAVLEKWNSNLDIHSIQLSGNDDYAISRDFLDEKSALDMWNQLLTIEYITPESLGEYVSF